MSSYGKLKSYLPLPTAINSSLIFSIFPNANMPINRPELQQFGHLELLARQVVEGFITGLHKSPFHGFSVEFAEYRQYNQGESTRYIDWRLFGKTDKLFVKRFEEETNLRCQVVIDVSSSMYYPLDAKQRGLDNKLQFSAKAAAALVYLLNKQRDATGLSIFAEELSLHTAARSAGVHMAMLYAELEKLIDTSWNNIPHRSNTAHVLHTLAEAVHKRSLIVLFSDMFDESSETEALFGALQHLKHNKHEVLLFHVTDRNKELEFEFENRPYKFIDLESGEEIRLQPSEIKESYTKQVQEFTQDLKMRCAQYKIDFIEADINQGYAQVLLPYLLKRGKMRV
jgi:uncharacterized protein (DUF58 family)